MNRDKYNLYNKAIDILEIDDILQIFHVYIVDILYHNLTLIGSKTEKNEKNLIESLSCLKVFFEILVLYLKKNNKDQALWTAMHSRLDNLKKLIEEREKDADKDR